MVRYSLPHQDGLVEPWDAATVYVNPPYGRDPARGTSIKDWLGRCDAAARGGAEVIALIPVAPNTTHWKRYVFGSAHAVCFLANSRVRFRVGGSEQNKGCPMAVAVVYWGVAHADRFARVFAARGAVVHLPR